jgi:hypothetical protein
LIICRDRGLGRDQGAPQVDLHDPIPRVAGIGLGIEENLAGAAADGVDDDVEFAVVRRRWRLTIRSASDSSR